MRLGKLMRQQRKALGITLRDVGKAARVSASTVCRVEAGKSVDVFSAMRLCRWLGVSVEYALGGKDVAAPSCGRCAHVTKILSAVHDDLRELHEATR